MDIGDEINSDRIKRLRDVRQILVTANMQAEQRLLQELQTHASLRQEVERVRDLSLGEEDLADFAVERWTSVGDDDSFENSIHQLSHVGDTAKIRSILESIGQPGDIKVTRLVNEYDEDGSSALMHAARHDHLETTRLLVQYGANVNLKSKSDKLTTLHMAAWSSVKSPSITEFPTRVNDESGLMSGNMIGTSVNNSIRKWSATIGFQSPQLENEESIKQISSADIVQFLVLKGALINERAEYSLTPLHYAAMRGNSSATSQLLKYPGIEMEALDASQLTPLHLACSHGSVGVAKILIRHKANLRAVGEKGHTPLHKAASIGNVELVKMITEAVKDEEELKMMLKDEDYENNSPLLLAVERGSMECVEHLLKCGANVNHCNMSKTYPLHFACIKGSLEIAKILIKNGSKVNCTNEMQQTPLMIASVNNHSDIIKYLLTRGAKLEARDKRNSTALHFAASGANKEAVEMLLNHNADFLALDNSDRSALHLAVTYNHIEVVQTLLDKENFRVLLELHDRFHNTPLHVACILGHLECAVALMNANASIESKNIDEDTPIHCAATEGYHLIVEEILRRNQHAANYLEIQSRNSLHLACIGGHSQVVSILIANGSEIISGDYFLQTPLDYAASCGHKDCAKLLLDAGSPVDPTDKNKKTPLHLAAQYGHPDVTSLLIDEKASVTMVNSEGYNALTIALQHGHREVASIILNSKEWRNALNNSFNDQNGNRQTPLRLMIRDFPDLAKRVFDRCITTNLQNTSIKNGKKSEELQTPVEDACATSEDLNFQITFNYEFLDDSYILPEDNNESSADAFSASKYFRPASRVSPNQFQSPELSSPWDDNNRLLPNSVPYTHSGTKLKNNHPLLIMVKNERATLLGHPLCMALVRHKWRSYSRYVYYSTLMLYLVFLMSLTGYLLLTPPPYSSKKILADTIYSTKNSTIIKLLQDQINRVGFGGADICPLVQDFIGNFEHRNLTLITKYIIMGLAAVHLLKELFQWTQARLLYLSLENLIEWSCYTTAILFVFDFDECSYQTGMREGWQWRTGAISITLCWLNLLSNVRKVPLLGIYVVMFTDIMQTFLKFSLVCILFVVAFSFGFHALLAEHENFSTIPFTLVKTFVMMLGEFDYVDLFFTNVRDEEGNDLETMPYPVVTMIFFVAFIVIMPIIIMNLLVGLAVDDIKSVQDNAVLSRLAMKVNLNFDVEKNLPDCLRKRFLVRCETIFPNKYLSFWDRIFYDASSLLRIKKRLLDDGKQTGMTLMANQVNDLTIEVRTLREDLKKMVQDQDQQTKLMQSIAKMLAVEDTRM